MEIALLSSPHIRSIFYIQPLHSSSRPQHTQHKQSAAQKPHPGYPSQSGQLKAAAHYPYSNSGNNSGSGGAGLGIHSGDSSSQSYQNASNPSAYQQHSMMPPPSSSSHQSPRQPGLHQSAHNNGGNEHQGQSPVLHHPSQASAHQRQHSTGGGQVGISQQSSQGGSKTPSVHFQSRPSATASAISPMAAIQQAKAQVRLQQQQTSSSQKPQSQHVASRDHGQGQPVRRQEPPSPQQQQQQQFGSPNSPYSAQHARLSSGGSQSSSLQSTPPASAPVVPRSSHSDSTGAQPLQSYNQHHGPQKSTAMAMPRTASPTMSMTSQRPVQPVSHPGSTKTFASPTAGSSNSSNSSGSPHAGHGSSGGPAVVTTPKSSTNFAPALAPPLLSPSIANSPTGFISTSTLLMMARNANANTNNPQGSPSTGPATPSPTSSSIISPSMTPGQQQHQYGGTQSHYHRQQ